MMLFWWIIPLLLVFAFTDRRDEGASFRGTSVWLWGLLLLGIFALGGFGMGFGHMGGYGHMGGFGYVGGFGGGFGWIAVIVHLLLLGAVIWGAVTLFRRHHSGGSIGATGASAPTEAEEIKVLKLRLAKGEITPEEYDLLKQKLKD